MACAAAHRTLQIHQRDKVWEKARRDGEYIVSRPKTELANHPKVGDIRGRGMELGIDIVKHKASKEKNAEVGSASRRGPQSLEDIVAIAARHGIRARF